MTCDKSEKSSTVHTSMDKSYGTYTSMDITTEANAAVKGKGWNGKCEVVGKDSFASLTGCHSNAVACVCKTLWQAKATLTS